MTSTHFDDKMEFDQAKVACPQCGSLALNIGSRVTTLLAHEPFTDDEGRVHDHDPNTSSQAYTCRRCGRGFSKTERGSCWCGWKAGQPEQGATDDRTNDHAEAE